MTQIWVLVISFTLGIAIVFYWRDLSDNIIFESISNVHFFLFSIISNNTIEFSFNYFRTKSSSTVFLQFFHKMFWLLNHFSNVFLSPNLIVYFKFCIYFSFNSFTKLFLVDIFFVQLFDKNFLICIFPLKFPNVLISQILFYTSHSAFISLYYISYTFSRRYFFRPILWQNIFLSCYFSSQVFFR